MAEFRPITVEEAPAYFVEAGLARPGELVTAMELGGGVSSAVILGVTPRGRFILKQALPRLRVQKDWPSRPDRSAVEVAALQAFAPLLPPGAVPRVVWDDPGRHCFIMTAAPETAVNWKSRLLAGEADPAVAARAGALLGAMHLGSAADPALAARFDDREFFHTLRVDPYLWEIRRVYPELRATVEPLVDRMLARRLAVVHGDYSPKNMLVAGDGLTVLDFEVAHWGDPAFDLAFCLNHFFLKGVYFAPRCEPYFSLARVFWAAYAPALRLEPAETLLPRTLLLQGALMLARIDGKSPVEYITDPAQQDRVRSIARRLLAQAPATVEATIALVRQGLARA